MQSPLDLKSQNPRSPLEAWADVVWIPRMADKARAAKANTLGDFMYPCPMDKIILEFLKLDADRFLELATQKPDESLALWFEDHLKNVSPDDLQKGNQALLTKQPDTPEKWAKFEAVRDEFAPDRKDIVTWAALIDLEEGHA